MVYQTNYQTLVAESTIFVGHFEAARFAQDTTLEQQ